MARFLADQHMHGKWAAMMALRLPTGYRYGLMKTTYEEFAWVGGSKNTYMPTLHESGVSY